VVNTNMNIGNVPSTALEHQNKVLEPAHTTQTFYCIHQVYSVFVMSTISTKSLLTAIGYEELAD